MVITDEAADRMRAMAIVSEQPIDPERMRVLLEADFDTALDAKYALWEGKLWSVFVHPLSTLSDSEVTNGIVQVVNLVKTYGSSYSSTDMQFSPGSRQPTPGAEL
ncbi:MAG: hypothetical protein SF187_02155 [Deltaproteobacteria bacterium]|nr:hypothetical protein [Deltaproteobacteria bacterium]